MAKAVEWTDVQKLNWRDWVASRPEVIRATCERFPADRLYKLKSTGHRVTIMSYCEDGTVTVAVTGKFNLVAFERAVFGVKTHDLEECDLPAPDAALGVLLTDEADIKNHIDSLKGKV